jgi:hypothetical protein
MAMRRNDEDRSRITTKYVCYEEIIRNLQNLAKSMLQQRHHWPLTHDERNEIEKDVTTMGKMLQSFGDQHIEVFYGPVRHNTLVLMNELSSLRAECDSLRKALAKVSSASHAVSAIDLESHHHCVQYFTGNQTAEVFLQGILHSRPTTFHDLRNLLVGKADLLSNWDYLIEHHGEMKVKVAVLKDQQESKPPFESMEMSLTAFLSTCRENAEFAAMHYLQQNELHPSAACYGSFTSTAKKTLLEAMRIAEYAPVKLCSRIATYACHLPTWYINAAKGIKTSLHFDRSSQRYTSLHENGEDEILVDEGKHNLFLQVTGSRVFVLFPPEFTSALLPTRGSFYGHVSQSTTFLHSITEFSNDLEEQINYILLSPFPSLAEPWKHRLEITLHAGDTLLIPAKWWHYTLLTAPGMGLNWWFHKNCFTNTDI